MATNYSPKIVTDGLVLCLDAANPKSYPGSGNTWYDLSGNGNDGTLVNGPVFESTNGGAINCDAADDMIYVNDTLNLNYVTVSLFYRRDSNSGTRDNIIFNKEFVWEMRDLNSNLSWAVEASNQGWFWVDTGYNVNIGETLSVDLSYDGNFVKTYVNGTEIQLYTYPSGGVLHSHISYPKLNSRDSSLTTWRNGGDHTFYNFKVYNRALSESEIKQNFEAIRGRYGL